MVFRNLLLPGIFIPTLFSSLALLLAVATWGKRSNSTAGGAGLVIAVSFLSAYVAMTGMPPWPPIEATQRLFYWLALAGLLVVFYAVAFKGSRAARGLHWPVNLALVAVLLVLLLQTPLRYSWSITQSVVWLLPLCAAGMAWRWATARFLEPDPKGGRGLLSAVVLLVLVSCTAVLLGLSASARLAQLAGAVACGVGVIEVGSRVLRRRPWLPGDATPLTLVLLGLLVIGTFYAEVSYLNAALVCASFLMLGIDRIPWAAARSKWLRPLPLLPMAVAVALAANAAANPPADPYDYSSSSETLGELFVAPLGSLASSPLA